MYHKINGYEPLLMKFLLRLLLSKRKVGVGIKDQLPGIFQLLQTVQFYFLLCIPP